MEKCLDMITDRLAARSNTYVANASGKPLLVFYSTKELELQEKVIEDKSEGEAKLGGGIDMATKLPSLTGEIRGRESRESRRVFKPTTTTSYIRIPVNASYKIPGVGAIYVTVCVESSKAESGKAESGDHSDKWRETIVQNFLIPSDRSFIVTRDPIVKFQKYGANIWVDEGGYDHRR